MVKGGPLRFAVIAALAVALAGFVVSPALSGPGFLTDDEAAKVFLKKKRASKVFLKKKRANNRFLTKMAATSRYYSKTEADGRFLRPEVRDPSRCRDKRMGERRRTDSGLQRQ